MIKEEEKLIDILYESMIKDMEGKEPENTFSNPCKDIKLAIGWDERPKWYGKN